jgi:large subunit ribosomal protein L15
MHPIHSRLFKPTPITQLATQPDAVYQYDLPDPTRRKFLESYRDRAKRGYLSYQVNEGHTPSLYFRTPGTGVTKAPKSVEKQQVSAAVNKMW